MAAGGDPGYGVDLQYLEAEEGLESWLRRVLSGGWASQHRFVNLCDTGGTGRVLPERGRSYIVY